MKVSQQSAENGEVVLEVEVEAERLLKHIRRASRGIKIPGFREGKAPLPLIQQHVGRETLMDESLRTLVPEVVAEAVADQGIDAFDMPKVDVQETEPVVQLIVTVPLQPSVELGDYKALRVDDAVEEVSDEVVDASLEQLRQSQRVVRGVDRPAAEGDVVVFTGRAADGDTELFNVEDQEYLLDADNDIGIEGFRESLLGMSVGDVKDFSGAMATPTAANSSSDDEDEGGADDPSEVTGEDAEVEALDAEAEGAGDEESEAGDDDEADDPEVGSVQEPRIAEVHLEVVGVREVVLPDLDDELAVSVGIDGVSTLAELRQRIRDDLQMERERYAAMQYESQVIEALSDQSEFHLSGIVVTHEAGHILEREAERRWQALGSRGPKPKAEDLGPDAQETAEGIAETNLKRALMLDKVAELEAIEIGDDEVSAEIARMNELAKEQAEAAKRLADERGDETPPEAQPLEDSAEVRSSLRYTMRNRRCVETLMQFARGLREDEPAVGDAEPAEVEPVAAAEAGQ